MPVGQRWLFDHSHVVEVEDEGVHESCRLPHVCGDEDRVALPLLLGQEGSPKTILLCLLEKLAHPRVVIADIPAVDRHRRERLDVHVQEHRVGAVLLEQLGEHVLLVRGRESNAGRVRPLERPRDGGRLVELVVRRALRRVRQKIRRFDRQGLLASVGECRDISTVAGWAERVVNSFTPAHHQH